MKKKGLALVLALVLLVAFAVGGTVAWLTATSDEVVNTFTTSDIDITLEESEDLDLKMIPGYDITKDPKAKVLDGSEDCYLFVKLEKSSNFDDYMTYEVADGWIQLTKDKDGKDITELVYYRVVDGTTNQIGTDYSVLKNDKVTVKGEVTKEQMNNLTEATYPTLTVTAYASQLHKNASTDFIAAEAWAAINPTT